MGLNYEAQRCLRIQGRFTLAPCVRQIGFIFDAVFDSQLGVGVLVTNGSVRGRRSARFFVELTATALPLGASRHDSHLFSAPLSYAAWVPPSLKQ